MRILVLHRHYGCGTGCCGHAIEIDGDEDHFYLGQHPAISEDHRAWAEELVRSELGAEHVADLDWERCRVIDD